MSDDDQRLFCIDVAIHSITFLRETSVPKPHFPSSGLCKLAAQFLDYPPLILCSNISTSAILEEKTLKLETGKSAMMLCKQVTILQKLENGQLTFAFIFKNSDDQLLNAGDKKAEDVIFGCKLNLGGAADYFKDNLPVDRHSDNGQVSKFTSVGTVDLHDAFGRKKARLHTGYRIWQLGSSLENFFVQHQRNNEGEANSWLPTNLFGYVQAGELAKNAQLVTTDTQTDVQLAKMTASADTQTASSPLHAMDKQLLDKPEQLMEHNTFEQEMPPQPATTITSKTFSEASHVPKPPTQGGHTLPQATAPAENLATADREKTPLPMPKAETTRPGSRDSAIRRLISELELLTRSNPYQHPKLPENVPRPSSKSSPVKFGEKQQKTIATYATGADFSRPFFRPNSHRNPSFNVYSKIYSARAPGYGMTKAYLQRLAYLPLYHPELTMEPFKGQTIFSNAQPRKTVLKKVYMKDQGTSCDQKIDKGLLENSPKKDAQIEAIQRCTTSSTQTNFAPDRARSDNMKMQKRRIEKPTKPGRDLREKLSLEDMRNLMTALNEAVGKTETSKDHVENPQRRKRLMSIGQRSASSLVRRHSLVGVKTMRKASLAKTHTTPELYSSITSSVKSEMPSRGPSSFTESVTTQIEASSDTTEEESEDEKSSDRDHVEHNEGTEQTYNNVRDTASPDAFSRSRVSSQGAASVKFSEKIITARRSQETAKSDAHGHQQIKGDDEPRHALSPVSEYLQNYRLREAVRQKQIRSMSVRTESVSSYMPSDLEQLAYSSNSSPLQLSAKKFK